ncbi:unnamed protein product [Cuscuta campestris]|uniref:Uncharacterized protein n=1 Tax=Cuscuta campestris TaxID=132261 RepID=A0A484MMJ2_9ASTE|nr:unnamed protein product [Cuscuta campestris]
MNIGREIADASGKIMSGRRYLNHKHQAGLEERCKDELSSITPSNFMFIMDEKPDKVFTRDGNDFLSLIV